MPNEYSEPGKLVLTLFDNLIDRIKSSSPVRTDGKSLTSGIIYSQLVLGMPVDPKDYMGAWSPAGGGTIQDAVSAAQPAPAAGGASPGPDPRLQKAINAAWKTSRLVDSLIMVTNDDSFQEYPGTRRISAAYESIIHGMQSKPMPPLGPDVQAQIDEASKILYDLDPADGSIQGKTKLYKEYITNSQAYAQAKADFAVAQATVLANPALASSWPMLSAVYQQKLDDAWDTFKTEGANKIERALDILNSVGISMQDHMIAKARKLYDVWNLGIAGVPDPTPYSYISPTGWADPDDDEEGWETLKVESNEYHSRSEFHSSSFAESHFQSNQEENAGGGGVSYFGFGAHASATSSSSDWSSSYQAQSGSSYQFHNDAKNLSIEISYMLCTINRPWLIGDLFYLRDWWLVNNSKSCISDGTINGQVQNVNPLMPMIPTQFLVIRNVKIHADKGDWGGDGQTLQQMYSDSQAQASNWSTGGGGGFNIGFFSIEGEGSHSEGHSSGSFSSRASADSVNNFGWSFDGQTLEIKGAQIIAWLSEIVPGTPPLDDPGLKK